MILIGICFLVARAEAACELMYTQRPQWVPVIHTEDWRREYEQELERAIKA